jgi:DNA helicase HerA-like ATPase
MSNKILVGKSGARAVELDLTMACRHGLVTGSTGTGKTVTLQRLAEEFSAAGVPVFAADIKGDLSGIAERRAEDKALARSQAIGLPYRPQSYPCAFWDIYGDSGLQIRTSVQAMGAELISRMLDLNQTQAGTLAIAFRKSEDDREWMLDLDDLRWTLDEMLEHREDVCRKYGNITTASISTIQRHVLALEQQGGHNLFGEPPFDIQDLLRLAEDGRGVVNLLAAERLLESPKLYATFLLWLLTELFRVLPEAGDLNRPKIAFFFDEAHLLFRDAPPALIQQIERLVRLVRSKGVSVWMVTQSPTDVPDGVLAQLGNRIQHALRAYTQKEQKMVRASAAAFRENRGVDVKAAITTMGVGEARIMVAPPQAQIGPIPTLARDMHESDLYRKYFYSAVSMASAAVFKNRMRAERGLSPLSTMQEWKPGEFQAYVPELVPSPSRAATIAMRRRAASLDLLKWSAVLVALYLAFKFAL